MLLSFRKHTVGADLGAAFAVDAPILMVMEGVLFVGIKHQITPMRRLTPSTIPRMLPETAMNAMIGTYRKISFFTPVR
jgi:hypothetical protein